tara:strand:- start:226 stop:2298 length:2073 start_codon:yes stop_codon:yes gene_type:complete
MPNSNCSSDGSDDECFLQMQEMHKNVEAQLRMMTNEKRCCLLKAVETYMETKGKKMREDPLDTDAVAEDDDYMLYLSGELHRMRIPEPERVRQEVIMALRTTMGNYMTWELLTTYLMKTSFPWLSHDEVTMLMDSAIAIKSSETKTLAELQVQERPKIVKLIMEDANMERYLKVALEGDEADLHALKVPELLCNMDSMFAYGPLGGLSIKPLEGFPDDMDPNHATDAVHWTWFSAMNVLTGAAHECAYDMNTATMMYRRPRASSFSNYTIESLSNSYRDNDAVKKQLNIMVWNYLKSDPERLFLTYEDLAKFEQTAGKTTSRGLSLKTQQDLYKAIRDTFVSQQNLRSSLQQVFANAKKSLNDYVVATVTNAELRERFRDKKEALDTEILKLKAAIVDAQAETKQAQAETKQAQAETKRAQAETKQAQEKVNEEESRLIKMLMKQPPSGTHKGKRDEKREKTVKEENERLKEENKRLKEEIEGLNEQKEENDHLKEENERLKKEIEGLKEQKERWKEENAHLEKENERVLLKEAILRNEFEQQEEHKKRLEQELEENAKTLDQTLAANTELQNKADTRKDVLELLKCVQGTSAYCKLLDARLEQLTAKLLKMDYDKQVQLKGKDNAEFINHEVREQILLSLLTVRTSKTELIAAQERLDTSTIEAFLGVVKQASPRSLLKDLDPKSLRLM